MRKSFSIPHAVPLPAYQSQQSPRARRPTLDPAASPQIARLSRVPNIPGIYEDEEEDESPEEDRIASPTIRRRTKARLSASRLPLPLRVASPPLLPPTLLVEKVKKKSSRRQSGLLTVDTTRPASPAVGSPIQKLAQEIQEDEEIAVVDEMGVGVELEAALNREKKGKAREVEPFDEDSGGRTRERKRRRDEEEISNSVVSPLEGTTKLKDVTNSPRGRAALPPLDTNTSGIWSTILYVYITQRPQIVNVNVLQRQILIQLYRPPHLPSCPIPRPNQHQPLPQLIRRTRFQTPTNPHTYLHHAHLRALSLRSIQPRQMR